MSEISVIDDELLVEDYETGAIVPANTGVMVSSATAGDHTITLSSEAGTSVLDTDNMLKPSSEAMTGDCLFYRLTMHNGTSLGFWYGAAEGAAFTIAANKSYLAVPEEVAAKMDGFSLGGETTGIDSIHNSQFIIHNDTPMFNLSGQRVSESYKGIVIVNGKKNIRK